MRSKINRRVFLQGLAYGAGALALPISLARCNSGSGSENTTSTSVAPSTATSEPPNAFSFPGLDPDRIHMAMTNTLFAGNTFYIIPEYTVSGGEWGSYTTISIDWTQTLTDSGGIARGAVVQTELSYGRSRVEFRPDSSDPMILHVTAQFTATKSGATGSWTSIRFGRNYFRGPYEGLDFNFDVIKNGFVEQNGNLEQVLGFYPGFNNRFVIPHTAAVGTVEYRGLDGEVIDKWPLSGRTINGNSVYFTGVDAQDGHGMVWHSGAVRSLGIQNWNEWEIVCAPHVDFNYGDVAQGETVTRKAAFLFTNTGQDGFIERRNRWLSGSTSPV